MAQEKFRVPFGTLKVTQTAVKHIQECCETNHVTLGPKVELLENKFKELFGYPYAVGLSSGTSALIAALITLYDFGAKPGDGVICPALTFIASANAIRAAGFIPVFVDIKKETLGIDETKIEDAINSSLVHICGILAVNLMGKPVRLDEINYTASYYNLKVIVDNCEAYGCKYKNKFSLEYADIEVSSHYVAHILCSAELGIATTHNRIIRDSLKSIRSHGREPNSLYFNHIRYGLNLKPTDLNACIGLGEVDNFWKIFEQRRFILNRYREAIKGYENQFFLIEEYEKDINAPHAFSLTMKDNGAEYLNIKMIKSVFDEAKIQWKRNFQCIPTSQAFKLLPNSQQFKNAEHCSNLGIHIGCSQYMIDDDIEYVCNTLKDICKNLK